MTTSAVNVTMERCPVRLIKTNVAHALRTPLFGRVTCPSRGTHAVAAQATPPLQRSCGIVVLEHRSNFCFRLPYIVVARVF